MGHSDAIAEITANNQRRHSHGDVTPRCKQCNMFVSKGDPVDGVYRYECARCGHVVESVRKRMAAVGD